MSFPLVEIEPQELKFILELKKQSSCSIRLLNKTDHYVAFKVKTTNPKKYCVRPNTGVIGPKSTCDFIVTMQAQRVAPPEMICKDKFLIQSVVVPVGTAEEMITSSLFTKDGGKCVQEDKLRVILASPPHSPVASPKNGAPNEVPAFGPHSPVLSPMNGVNNEVPAFRPHSPVLSPMHGVNNEVPASDASILKNQIVHRVETASPQHRVTEVVESKGNSELLSAAKALTPETEQDIKEPELVKDIENMKTQISELEFKLKEAEVTISELIEEKRLTVQERETLQQELALLRNKKGSRKVRVGFPFLFVCMIALISAFLGYLLHF